MSTENTENTEIEILQRSAEEVLHFIAERRLRFVWVTSMIPGSDLSTLGQDTLLIIDQNNVELYAGRYFSNKENPVDILREGVEFVMDQEEL
jgi:hypothetical protein|tara:strand:- start:843 stop:1118 length:276 start_codon:yes stop_codon:yes gene_type:complete